MATEGKYGRVTTERGNIGTDEPVFLLRGLDAHTPAVIDFYRSLCVQQGSPAEHCDDVADARDRIAAWQAKNGSRIPGMAAG